MNTTIRPAERKDALHVAALVDMAGHGIDLGRWLKDRNGDLSVIGAARRAVLDPRNRSYHFSNAQLVEIDGEVAGALVGGMIQPNNSEHMEAEPHIVPLLTLESRLVGWWSIVATAIYPEFRGRGLARLLLNHAERLARDCGAVGLSLVVEDANAAAVAVYRRAGYEPAETLPWVAYDGHSGPREWVMMTRPFTPGSAVPGPAAGVRR